jgi:hypothetical protein
MYNIARLLMGLTLSFFSLQKSGFGHKPVITGESGIHHGLRQYFYSYIENLSAGLYSYIAGEASLDNDRRIFISKLDSTSTAGTFEVQTRDIVDLLFSYILFKPIKVNVDDFRDFLEEGDIQLNRSSLSSIFSPSFTDENLEILIEVHNSFKPILKTTSCFGNSDDRSCLTIMIRFCVNGHHVDGLLNIGFLFMNTLSLSRIYITEMILSLPDPSSVDKIFNPDGLLAFANDIIYMAVSIINGGISILFEGKVKELKEFFKSLRIGQTQDAFKVAYELQSSGYNFSEI